MRRVRLGWRRRDRYLDGGVSRGPQRVMTSEMWEAHQRMYARDQAPRIELQKREAKPKVAQCAAAPLERDVLAEVLAVLEMHPRVAFVWRQNTGAMDLGERYVRFSFKGCSDVLGMLKTGQFLAIETKRIGKEPTEDQAAFLANVNRNGGLAFVARSAADVWDGLNAARS